MPTCAQCKWILNPGDKFCSQCGVRVKHPSHIDAETGERRLIAVLFCDLVGSTELCTRLDPEEMQEIIRNYQTTAVREVERYGGYIAQYLGDGILAYFGYPIAHETPQERAILAALAMRDGLIKLSGNLKPTWGVSLSARFGIHSGVVVIGLMGKGSRSERLALGNAPNIAARIQGKAAEGEVLISEDTLTLIPGRFRVSDRGCHELKGVSTPMRLYAVTSEMLQGFLTRIPTHKKTFGRDRELMLLRGTWRKALTGQGQLVEIIGEAGLGKSHLALETLQQIGQPAIEIYCSELFSKTAFWPLSNWLLHRLDSINSSSEQRQLSLQTDLENQGLSMDLLPSLCHLIGVKHPEIPADPPAARLAIISALKTYLLAASNLILIEDIHWADASTEEFLTYLAGDLAQAHVMVLVTSRRELPWAEGACPKERIRLEPLDQGAAACLLRDSAPEDLSTEQLNLLLIRGDGMPMFLHELARSIQAERHNDSERPHEVPYSLQSLLMTSLDRVGAAKKIAQTASVLGREFSRADLEEFAMIEPSEIDSGLKDLEQAGILKSRRMGKTHVYYFRHALIHDVAYDSLLHKVRAQIHRRIALSLEERLGTLTPDHQQLGQLAYHFRRSLSDRSSEQLILSKVLKYMHQAGTASIAISAYKEAQSYMSEAKQLIDRMADNRERWETELRVHSELSVIHRATIGFGALEVEEDLHNALAAAKKLGEQPVMAKVSLAIWSLLLGRADYVKSLKIARNVLSFTSKMESQAIKLRALAACANSEFWLGKVSDSLKHCEEVIAEYTLEEHGTEWTEHGWDLGVHAYQVATWSAWLLGRESALEYEARLIELAQCLQHPLTSAIAENTSCMLHVLRRDPESTIAAADRMIKVSEQYGLSFYKMLGDLFRAQALFAMEGDEADFLVADKIFTDYQMQTGRLAQTFLASFMAKVYASRGHHLRALEVVRQALSIAEHYDERVFEPTLRRQEKSLLSCSPPNPAALDITGALTSNKLCLCPNDPLNHWLFSPEQPSKAPSNQ
jgi:class 3 adenylate cyclase